ncbi:methionyl-tRNA formyltransferase [Allokutzneria albata]|uniref:Methionyl-tRNA formyltransferase n=1 Tax=Allokutzneria albata TaxID=211114 RepID=A0A1G9SGJ1_ALLAB|nr:formyltransferase family protein [Allokutzneria albata]SDM34559.1 methionyl-tRNA formyltransferase [Allokutzneria albata]
MRVAVIAALPQTAPPLVDAVRELGHEVPVVVSARRPADWPGHLLSERDLPDGVDLAVPSRPAAITTLLTAYAPDVAVSYGYPRKLPGEAVSVPGLGTVNCHPSALPHYRGPNPVGWAVRNGEKSIGVTWHRMDAELDTGAILEQTRIPLSDEDWSFSGINTRVLGAAVPLLPSVLAKLTAGDAGQPQDAHDTPWAGLFGADYAEIDLSGPARAVHDQVRAWNIMGHNPRVTGPVVILDGARWKVRRTSLTQPPAGVGRLVRCGDGPLWITAADRLA